jgi:hypothetical protein
MTSPTKGIRHLFFFPWRINVGRISIVFSIYLILALLLQYLNRIRLGASFWFLAEPGKNNFFLQRCSGVAFANSECQGRKREEEEKKKKRQNFVGESKLLVIFDIKEKRVKKKLHNHAVRSSGPSTNRYRCIVIRDFA